MDLDSNSFFLGIDDSLGPANVADENANKDEVNKILLKIFNFFYGNIFQ